MACVLGVIGPLMKSVRLNGYCLFNEKPKGVYTIIFHPSGLFMIFKCIKSAKEFMKKFKMRHGKKITIKHVIVECG